MARSLKALLTRVERLLAAEFTALQSGLEIAQPADRVFGFIVSPAFEGLDHHERQARLRKVLHDDLSEDELSAIGPIVTMTPAEADISPVADQPPAETPKPKKRAG